MIEKYPGFSENKISSEEFDELNNLHKAKNFLDSC